MQVLNAPTRDEVDRAHAKGRWLEIGIPSIKNAFHVSGFKTLAWVLFNISSVPIHLLSNSAVFETDYQGNQWWLTMASESFLQGGKYYGPGAGLISTGQENHGPNAYWIQYGTNPEGWSSGSINAYNDAQSNVARNISATAANAGNWKNISAASCRAEYQTCQGRRQYHDLVMVLDIQGESEDYEGWVLNDLYNMSETSYATTWDAYIPLSEPNSLWFAGLCTNEARPGEHVKCDNQCIGPLGLASYFAQTSNEALIKVEQKHHSAEQNWTFQWTTPGSPAVFDALDEHQERPDYLNDDMAMINFILLKIVVWKMSLIHIRHVAVVGGTGSLGKYIVKELVDQGFQVSILSRDHKQDEVLNGVIVKTVDYNDLESLKAALTGEDAVVSAIASSATGPQQQKLADAAFAAGVKRFIPSEFGINTRKVQGLPIGKIVAGKTNLVDDLQKKAEENNGFSWTGLSNGLFFDLNLELGIFGFDSKAKRATIYDSGNEPFQTTNVGLIAKAVASILKHPDDTANKYLSVASFQPTLNQILQIVEGETGSKWTVDHVSTQDLQKVGEEKLANGDFSAFRELLRVHLYRDGEGHPVPKDELANKLLELPEEEDLRGTLRKWLSSAGTV
ncbi:hypothetical protein VMCG_09466 [Cytospora schulzeri]|uniref:Uncharacterized protein n=1 Tax=Cytospora schulzeri TaxID=448051 RepID=A0A423VKI6_9PEZI|nr:hypothetical protein VMCG_09466 [Valsa malicola]